MAVRVDAGNPLVFADPLTSGEDDRSVAGVGAASGKVVELGQLTDVRGESCSWNTSVIACGGTKEFVLHRFAPADCAPAGSRRRLTCRPACAGD